MGYEDLSKDELIKEIKSLQERLLVLNNSTQELKSSEDALQLDEARLEALLALTQMSEASEPEIMDFALAEAIRLTGSEIGWIGAVSEDDSMVTLYNWTSDNAKACGVQGMPLAYYIKGGGLWAEPIFQRKPVIVNDYSQAHPRKKGLPPGHIQIRRFMAIPIFDGERIVAVAEVANKGIDYDSSDARQLTLLMSGVWRVIMRNRTEKALQESKSQAELYVDLMGHDINNMNQIALGYLELAGEKISSTGVLSQEDRYLIDKPVETLRNSSRLIDNVRKLQSARSGGLRTLLIDLDRVLMDVVKDHSGMPGREININYVPVEGCIVRANGLIRDVFSNIVGNAVKHSHPDKPLNIDIKITKSKVTGKDHYLITIEDNGPGIPDIKKATLFDRISIGEKKTQGSGLGLGLVKTLVDDYGGKVWAEDRVSGDHTRGTRLTVMLPSVE